MICRPVALDELSRPCRILGPAIALITLEAATEPALQVVRGRGKVTLRRQQLRQRPDLGRQLGPTPLSDDLVANHVLARQHRRVGRMSRDPRTEALLKERTLLRDPVQVRTGQPGVAIARCRIDNRNGGGGNRTRVRSRTGQSLYRFSSPFSLARTAGV